MPTYEGPLDLVAGAVVACGVRALSAAMRGQQIFSILRESDAAFLNVSADAVTGEVDVAAIDTFIGSDTGRWLEATDQTGGGHAMQGGFSAPIWASSALNGKPGFLGLGSIGTDANPITLADGKCTLFMVSKGDTAIRIASNGMSCFGGSSAWNDMHDGTNEAGGDYPGLIDDENFHIIESAWEFGQNLFLVDGAQLTPAGSFDSGQALGSITNDMQAAVGVGSGLTEFIVYPAILFAPDRQAIRQNIATFYGITLP